MDKNALRAVLEELVAMSAEPRRRALAAMAPGAQPAVSAAQPEDEACDVDEMLAGVDCGDDDGKGDQKKRKVM